jgi:hypothetical protein
MGQLVHCDKVTGDLHWKNRILTKGLFENVVEAPPRLGVVTLSHDPMSHAP